LAVFLFFGNLILMATFMGGVRQPRLLVTQTTQHSDLLPDAVASGHCVRMGNFVSPQTVAAKPQMPF
jgi:hypothetical protein